MKNTSKIFFVLATFSLIFTSCLKDTGRNFNISIADINVDNVKTTLNGTKVAWQNNDKVNINGRTYTVSVSGSSASVADVLEEATYYATYPATLAGSVSPTGITNVTIPTGYTYMNNVVETPLAAKVNSTDGSMVFYNLCSLVAVQLPNGHNVTRIELESHNTYLSGKGYINWSGNVPSFHSNEDATASKKVAISMGGGVMSDGKIFYIPVAQINNGSKLTFRIRTTSDGILHNYTVSKTTKVAVPANQIAKVSISESDMGIAADITDVTVAAFQVNASGKQVYFSKGNLQYQRSTNTWRFAPHQYDYVGGEPEGGSHQGNVAGSTNNNRGDAEYSGWQDLFGWGANGKLTYNAYQASTNNADYYPGEITFGDDDYRHDWGYVMYDQDAQGRKWRTMTKDEWQYVLSSRSGKSGKATVCGVPGVVLLPDGSWTNPTGCTFTATTSNYTTNTYNETTWTKMENAGAIFLPRTGRVGTLGFLITTPEAQYWTASPGTGNTDYRTILCLGYSGTTLLQLMNGNRYVGNAVRLVVDAE